MNESSNAHRATGHSARFDLHEAVGDAVNQLPPLPGADREDHVRIVTIEASYGGILGGSRLIVTVERIEGDGA